METAFDRIGSCAHAAIEYALNGVWMGVLLTILVAVVLRSHRRFGAATRHAIWLGVLVLLPFLPLFLPESGRELLPLPATEPALGAIPTPDPIAAGGSPQITSHLAFATNEAPPASSPPSLWPRALPLLFAVGWLGISALLLGRVSGAHRRLARRKRSADPLELPWSDEFARRLREARGRRPVRLLRSREVAAPQAAGLFDPAVLLPHRLPEQLERSELEILLLHELAHLQRRDDWSRLTQRVVRALFFFHPAVLWLGRRLDLERELACDDAVLAATGRPGDYCRTLTRLLSLPQSPPTLAPGFTSGRKQVFTRFERILARDPRFARGFSMPRFAAALLLVGGVAPLLASTTSGLELPGGTITWEELTTYAETASPIGWRTTGDAAPATMALPASSPSRLNGEEIPPGRLVDWSHWSNLLQLSVTLLEPDGERELRTIYFDDEPATHVVMRGALAFPVAAGALPRIPAGGFLALRTERGGTIREVDLTPAAAETGHDLVAYVDGRRAELDDTGRAWLTDVMRTLVRRGGIDAEGRARRIIAAGGLDAFLAEMPKLGSSWSRGLYYEALLAEADLNHEQLLRIIGGLEQHLEEEERADAWLRLAPRGRDDRELRAACAQAASTIASPDRRRAIREAWSLDSGSD